MHSSIKLTLCSMLLAPAVLATPSGLNNIPTADVAPQGVLVFQMFSSFGNDKYADLWGGFKTGLEVFNQKFEFGADYRAYDGKSGPVVFQGKYSLPLGEGLPALGLGIANGGITSEDRDRAGDPFYYALLTHDFKGLFRAHAGYGFQTDNNSIIFGLDKTFEVAERDLVLRTDLVQIQDEDQLMGSFGFLYALHEYVVLESWVSQPFDEGDPILTAKLNFVIKF